MIKQKRKHSIRSFPSRSRPYRKKKKCHFQRVLGREISIKTNEAWYENAANPTGNWTGIRGEGLRCPLHPSIGTNSVSQYPIIELSRFIWFRFSPPRPPSPPPCGGGGQRSVDSKTLIIWCTSSSTWPASSRVLFWFNVARRCTCHANFLFLPFPFPLPPCPFIHLFISVSVCNLVKTKCGRKNTATSAVSNRFAQTSNRRSNRRHGNHPTNFPAARERTGRISCRFGLRQITIQTSNLNRPARKILPSDNTARHHHHQTTLSCQNVSILKVKYSSGVNMLQLLLGMITKALHRLFVHSTIQSSLTKL